ncbi:hypothetical protein [Marinobacterium sp. BA1]|uniref:hypothetical protein n=1 Tax=Marinobacterium sp. BA1 TaxID=3138931 RepID=UPI0032E5BA88
MIKRDRIDNKSRRLRKKLHIGEFTVIAQPWLFEFKYSLDEANSDLLHDRLVDLHEEGFMRLGFAFSSNDHLVVHLERSSDGPLETFKKQARLIESMLMDELGIVVVDYRPEGDECDAYNYEEVACDPPSVF